MATRAKSIFETARESPHSVLGIAADADQRTASRASADRC
jgi:hypothetical protein